MDLKKLQTQCEEWIRTGEGLKAEAALNKLDFDSVPRSQLHVFCSLARRAQAWPLSLRALRALVYPKTKHSTRATPQEKIEYILALRRAGALTEADRLLSSPELQTEPRAILARAFGMIYRWDYAGALPELARYLACPGLTEYEVLVAEVNRLACLNFLGEKEFETLFLDLEKRLSVKNHHLLLGNCLEMKSHYLIGAERWQEARQVLDRAEAFLEKNGGRSLLYVKKWKRIAQALEAKSRDQLQDFRREALAAREWETLRNLDYFMTRLEPEGPWAYMVYFGTPYENFRSHLEAIRSFPETWDLSWEGKPGKSFDLWFPGGEEGGLPHRMIALLTQDLYRPLNGGEIFSILHEEEYFDIDTSLTRVRKMLSRARDWLKEVGCPLRIESDKTLYSARLEKKGALKVRKPVLGLSREKFIFERYRHVPNPPESAAEWAKTLNVTSANVSRLLKSGVEAGVLKKIGQGRYTRYIPT